jgi:hypothetical protein
MVLLESPHPRLIYNRIQRFYASIVSAKCFACHSVGKSGMGLGFKDYEFIRMGKGKQIDNSHNSQVLSLNPTLSFSIQTS